MLQFNDDMGGDLQFLMSSMLQSMTHYILVATTFFPNVTGVFSIVVSGSGSVNLTHINIKSE